jgi:hypothetical protein
MTSGAYKESQVVTGLGEWGLSRMQAKGSLNLVLRPILFTTGEIAECDFLLESCKMTRKHRTFNCGDLKWISGPVRPKND